MEKNVSYEGFLVNYSLYIRNLFPQVRLSALNQQKLLTTWGTV